MANLKASCGRSVLVALSVVVFASVCVAQGAPTFEKVEPPSWWAGHSINPVRLLVRGRNLDGVRVEAISGGGLRTGLIRVNDRGTYMFVDVHIDADARPGRRSLRFRNAGGAVDVPFDLSAGLAARLRRLAELYGRHPVLTDRPEYTAESYEAKQTWG